MPCRAAKGLDCVFPIWITHCGHVWFTRHAAPSPSPAIPPPCRSERDFSRPRLSAAWTRHGMVCVNYNRLCRYGTWATWPRSASYGYQAEFHEGCYQKHTNPLNCRTRSSDISGYHADFHEGHGIIEGRDAAWHGRGPAWAWHGMCELGFNVDFDGGICVQPTFGTNMPSYWR
jgi:hypothetical protein